MRTALNPQQIAQLYSSAFGLENSLSPQDIPQTVRTSKHSFSGFAADVVFAQQFQVYATRFMLEASKTVGVRCRLRASNLNYVVSVPFNNAIVEA